MTATRLLLGVGVAAAIVLLLALPAIRLGHRFGWVDPPGGRKRHEASVPLVGGWLALFAWIGFQSATTGLETRVGGLLLAAGVGLFTIGWLDDLRKPAGRDVSVSAKLIVQLGTAALAAGVFPLGTADSGLFEIVIRMLVGGWIVLLVNAVNLIDGLDGLATGVVAIGSLALGVVGWTMGVANPYAWLVMVSAVALWVFNRAPARLYLGDSGSYLLGYLFALATLIPLRHLVAGGDSMLSLGVSSLVVSGVLWLELGRTVIRRMRSGASIWSPDRSHLHHLLERKEGKRESVAAFYWLAVYFACGGIAVAVLPAWGAVAVVVLWFLLTPWVVVQLEKRARQM